jgi:ferredoxin--NADP+ reductase
MSPGAPPLRVAVVGTGPAGCYAAEHLLNRDDVAVEINMFDRLPTPYGLVRAGVAPDHPQTKRAARLFEWTAARPGVQMNLNVDIGRHLSHEELLAHHHAVVYAVGATRDRTLGIAGEHLPGSHGAGDFVGWYNGHPDHRTRTFDLSGQRAVIVGNGNVALDIARILLLPPDTLAVTDIADHALTALRRSNLSEVVLLGRRGPAHAAFTSPELLALGDLPDIDIVVEPPGILADDSTSRGAIDTARSYSARLKHSIMREFAGRAATSNGRRIILKFLSSPMEILGDGRVDAVRIVRNHLVLNADGEFVTRPTTDTEVLQTSLVLRAIGYRAAPIAGVPVDRLSGTIANIDGRVIDPSSQRPLSGVYTTGWSKRGPSGVIGTNKKCSLETVELILDDHAKNLLPEPRRDLADLDRMIAQRQPAVVDINAWRRIDASERRRGHATGRPRVKFTRVEQMLAVGRT